MKDTKNSRSVNVETLNAMKTISEYIAENECYKKEWIETCKDEGFDYGRNSVYYLAKKSLTPLNQEQFEVKMLRELVSELTA